MGDRGGGDRLPTTASLVQNGVSTRIFLAITKQWKQPKCEAVAAVYTVGYTMQLLKKWKDPIFVFGAKRKHRNAASCLKEEYVTVLYI